MDNVARNKMRILIVSLLNTAERMHDLPTGELSTEDKRELEFAIEAAFADIKAMRKLIANA